MSDLFVLPFCRYAPLLQDEQQARRAAEKAVEQSEADCEKVTLPSQSPQSQQQAPCAHPCAIQTVSSTWPQVKVMLSDRHPTLYCPA